MRKLQVIFFCFTIGVFFSQSRDSLSIEQTILKDTLNNSSKIKKEAIEKIYELKKQNKNIPNNPMKSGIYSALLPGFGQYYNKKYWKIPIVWGGLGVGVGITMWNQRRYKRYFNAFQAQLKGEKHEFSDFPGVTKEVLGRTQDRFKRQRDYSIAITGLVYILNIIDAIVDAHLYEQKHDSDLAIQPVIIPDPLTGQNTNSGLSFTFRF